MEKIRIRDKHPGSATLTIDTGYRNEICAAGRLTIPFSALTIFRSLSSLNSSESIASSDQSSSSLGRGLLKHWSFSLTPSSVRQLFAACMLLLST